MHLVTGATDPAGRAVVAALADVLGRPPRTSAQWIAAHADAVRAG